jgi:hypothetical protein
MSYTPVDSSRGFWGFTARGYQIGNQSASTTGITGIADTGTTLLYLPSAITLAYYAQIPGSTMSITSGGWVFPCSAKVPEFSFNIEDMTFTIPGSYLNYARNSDGTCFGGIQDDSSVGTSIFGDIALKAAYVVFDSNGPRLGWAKKTLV